MPDTFTPNLNLTQPQVGASADTWGTKTNSDWAIIDALFATTGAGTVLVRDGTGRALLGGVAQITGAAATVRGVQLETAGLLRWLLAENSTAEGGSNAGSDFFINRVADDGVTLLGTSLSIVRSTGVATFETTPQAGANALLHAGNFNGIMNPSDPGVGQITMWDGTSDPTPPSGSSAVWMIADGRLISRTAFPAYFALVGTRYSVGDGSTTFGIRSMKEVVPVGVSSTQTLITQYSTATIGVIIGEGMHALVSAENGPHIHGTTETPHSHNITDLDPAKVGGGVNGGNAGSFSLFTSSPVTRTGTTNTALTGLTINSSGSGTPHNTVQPSITTNFIVRVK